MTESLRTLGTLLALPLFTVCLVSCSDDSHRQSSTYSQQQFTPAEQELAEQIVETSLDVVVKAMPSQGRQSEDKSKGTAMVNIGDKAIIDDDLHVALREFNAERPIGVVNLFSRKLDDNDLSVLDEMDQVFHLSISGEKITDAGLEHVGQLASIRELRMSGCKVSDEGLAKLSDLTDLHTLWISGSNVSGSGFAYLADLPALATIMAGGSPITDEGLESLAKINSLKTLHLTHTEITDQGLMHLRKLKNLQTVNVEFTKVTKGGAAALKRAMPKVQVIHGP